MKAILNNFLILIVFQLGAINAFAAPHPPNPGAKLNGPPPVGLSIDQDILVLVITAVFFGIYIVYNYHIKAKASI